MTSHRLIEIIIGAALIGYCAYAIHTGRVVGKWRAYNRSEAPRTFWTIVLVTCAFGVVFLLGAVSWRQ